MKFGSSGDKSWRRRRHDRRYCWPVCGALHGASGISAAWLEKLAMRERIDSLADAGVRTIIDLTAEADGLASYERIWGRLPQSGASRSGGCRIRFRTSM